MNVLAVEFSTSSAKALLFSTQKGVLRVESENFGSDICDTKTQDPQKTWECLVDIIRRITTDNPYPIDAIGLCSIWHSLTLYDGEMNTIGRTITWANNDASVTTSKYRADAALSERCYRKTGGMINSTYPYWQLVHIRETDPDKFAAFKYLGSQSDYFFRKLTGEFAMSKCTAAGSGFFNINTLDYDDEILASIGVKRDQLPPLREPFYHAPITEQAAKLIGVEPGVPVVIGGADGAMNQIAAAGFEEMVMTLSIGTSGALRMVSGETVLSEKPATWCYYLADHKRISGAATSGAGNCLTWFSKKFGGPAGLSLRELDASLPKTNIEQAPIFLPFIVGERCPGFNDSRTASFSGVTDQHDLYDLYYAVLEGVLFNLYQCYEILCPMMGYPKTIKLSGGILKSKDWVQMAADIFGADMTISKIEHQSTLSTAVLTARAMGYTGSLDHLLYADEIRVPFRPEMTEKYKTRFANYLKLYNA